MDFIQDAASLEHGVANNTLKYPSWENLVRITAEVLNAGIGTWRSDLTAHPS